MKHSQLRRRLTASSNIYDTQNISSPLPTALACSHRCSPNRWPTPSKEATTNLPPQTTPRHNVGQYTTRSRCNERARSLKLKIGKESTRRDRSRVIHPREIQAGLYMPHNTTARTWHDAVDHTKTTNRIVGQPQFTIAPTGHNLQRESVIDD